MNILKISCVMLAASCFLPLGAMQKSPQKASKKHNNREKMSSSYEARKNLNEFEWPVVGSTPKESKRARRNKLIDKSTFSKNAASAPTLNPLTSNAIQQDEQGKFIKYVMLASSARTTTPPSSPETENNSSPIATSPVVQSPQSPFQFTPYSGMQKSVDCITATAAVNTLQNGNKLAVPANESVSPVLVNPVEQSKQTRETVGLEAIADNINKAQKTFEQEKTGALAVASSPAPATQPSPRNNAVDALSRKYGLLEEEEVASPTTPSTQTSIFSVAAVVTEAVSTVLANKPTEEMAPAIVAKPSNLTAALALEKQEQEMKKTLQQAQQKKEIRQEEKKATKAVVSQVKKRADDDEFVIIGRSKGALTMQLDQD